MVKNITLRLAFLLVLATVGGVAFAQSGYGTIDLASGVTHAHVLDRQPILFAIDCEKTFQDGSKFSYVKQYPYLVARGNENIAMSQGVAQLQQDLATCYAGFLASGPTPTVTGDCNAWLPFDYEHNSTGSGVGDSFVIMSTTPSDYSSVIAGRFSFSIQEWNTLCRFNVSEGAPLSSGTILSVSSSVGANNVYGPLTIPAACDPGFQMRALKSDGVTLAHYGDTGLRYKCMPAPTDANLGSCDAVAGNSLVGHPINPATGNKYLHEVDMETDGASALQFARTYNSGTTSSFPGSPPGRGWSHSHLYALSVEGQAQYVSIIRQDGRTERFTLSGTQYVGLGSSRSVLAATTDGSGTPTGWLYRSEDGWLENYNTLGQLINRTSKSGYQQTYAYSGGAVGVNLASVSYSPLSVTDSFGRSLAFTYNPDGSLAGVTGPAGLSTSFAANTDSYGHITSLSATYPGSQTKQYIYGGTSFVDTPSTPAWNFLTGVVDENQSQYSVYTYNNAGQGVNTSLAGGVSSYTMAYDSGSLRTSVTDPLGTTRTSSFTQNATSGALQLTGQSQPGGAGCAAASSAATYDSNGNKNSEDDFVGNRVCWAYDQSRNLKLTAVEGLATSAACNAVTAANAALPSGARKTSYLWHPTWRVPISVAEPRRLTTLVYNGQPDPTNGNAIAACAPTAALLPDGSPIVVLCKHVVQATTDADGHLGLSATLDATSLPRTTSMTYNALGQVLSKQDPRGNSASWSYYGDTGGGHTTGDLQTFTNAVGHTTQYTSYDGAGRLLRSVEPSGATVDRLYTARGWLSSLAVTPTESAARTTGFTYDAVGQITRASLPDGTAIQFTYDAAHRLTTAIDGAGNSVTYALDNSGNRVGEEIKDPLGNLARNITRAFDTLNRLQSVTGAAQ